MHRLSLQDFDRAKRCCKRLPTRSAPSDSAGMAGEVACPARAARLVPGSGAGRSAGDGLHAKSARYRSALLSGADHRRAGAYESAEATRFREERYELALDVNPNDSLAWLLKGTLHAFRGEGKAAVEASQRALRLSSARSAPLLLRFARGDRGARCRPYERAIKLAETHSCEPDTYVHIARLAISQWQLGRNEEARTTVSELMQLEPPLRRRLARTLAQQQLLTSRKRGPAQSCGRPGCRYRVPR